MDGGWVCVAEGDAQVSKDFVQKKFLLRSVIATRCNFCQFLGEDDCKIAIFRLVAIFEKTHLDINLGLILISNFAGLSCNFRL
ncbi:MAG: hypothetical protein NC925_04370 [Candidatus Omnitrophica bacterium]|nr:hypothetical protein [Candidatus Omnitrophota bacterium]